MKLRRSEVGGRSRARDVPLQRRERLKALYYVTDMTRCFSNTIHIMYSPLCGIIFMFAFTHIALKYFWKLARAHVLIFIYSGAYQ